jgi:hypothetical protein
VREKLRPAPEGFEGDAGPTRMGRRTPLGSTTPLESVLRTLLLLLLFGLLVFSVQDKSPTADEQNHLARGLAYLRTGDLRLSQEHPPGINAWSAWPLLLDPKVHLPLESASWANAEWYGFADRLLWETDADPQAMVFATRVPVMWLTLVMAALVYRWARDLGGPWAGLLSLGLAVLDPNLLAHGRLTTNDMGLACTALAAVYALWRALYDPRLRGPRWGRWIAAGVALGAALLSKFSALVLIPVAGIVVVAQDLTGSDAHADVGPPARKPVRSLVRPLLALFGIAALVVWAGYAFTWGPIAALKGLPGPAPAFWAGIASILGRTGAGSPAFLLGRVSTEGWWVYFPVAFAVKTPLPAIVLLGVGGLGIGGLEIGKLGIRKSGNWGPSARIPSSQIPKFPNALLSLALPSLAFWALAIAGGFNIGYRHVLPSLPFLYVLAGLGIGKLGNWGIRMWSAQSRIPQFPNFQIFHLLPAALYAWLAVETLSIAPHYLAYFNQIAGGPDGGYRVLVDSNLDWGQDLPGLQRYVERTEIARVNLSWFGAAHPEAYGLSFHPLPGFWRFGGEAAAYGFNPYAPAPGVYAISATNLQGVKLADRDTYAWFRKREPDANVGHSILIYEVGPEQAPASGEAAVLGVPLSQLAQEDRELLARVDSVRRYDPQTGVILPAGARTVWYLTTESPGRNLETRQRSGYVVARSPGMPDPGPSHGSGSPEASFGGLVTPLWFIANQPGGDPAKPLQVTVHWGVARPPHRAAVSFAHLLDAEGRYLAGWDGLTAPATCWQAGDWIEQRYLIPLPDDLPPGAYQIEVGWYDADTGQRWPYVVKGETVGDRMLADWEIGRRADWKDGGE